MSAQFIPPSMQTPQQQDLLKKHHIEADTLPGYLHLHCSCLLWEKGAGYRPVPANYASAINEPTLLTAMQILADAGRDHILDELRKAELL